MAISLVTAATTEPVTIQDLKDQLRIDENTEDTYLGGLLKAATRYVERVSDRQLINATWRLSLDEFPCWEIRVPKPPLSSVSSITYVNSTGGNTTVASSDYTADTYSEPGLITPVFNATWPSPRYQNNAVTVTYVAGYGASQGSVPDTYKHAIKMLAGHWYENRESVLIGSISKELDFAVTNLIGAESFGPYK